MSLYPPTARRRHPVPICSTLRPCRCPISLPLRAFPLAEASIRVLIHQPVALPGRSASTARRAGARVIATASLRAACLVWRRREVRTQLLDSPRSSELGRRRSPSSLWHSAPSIPPALAPTQGHPDRQPQQAGRRAFRSRPGSHRGEAALDGRAAPSLRLRCRAASWPRAALRRGVGGRDGPLAGRTVVQLREPPPAPIEAGATYIVTGAAGALGGLLANWLSQAGRYRPVTVDRLQASSMLPRRISRSAPMPVTNGQ